MYNLGATRLSLHQPFEGDRMVFRSVASLDQYDIAMLQINPMIGHCTTSERLCQSRYSGPVSDPGLVIDIDEAHGSRHGRDQPALLVVHIGASHVGDGLKAVHHLAFVVLCNEVVIPCGLDLLCDPSHRPIPGFSLPLVTVRGAI